MSTEYDVLLESWENTFDESELQIDEASVDDFKRLIFDTYHFIRENVGDSDTIKRSYLPLYRSILRVEIYLDAAYIEGISEAESETYSDALKGLCCVFENGFDIGYGKYPLPMGLGRHASAGGAEPEADMSTYESYEETFDANVEMLRADYGME